MGPSDFTTRRSTRRHDGVALLSVMFMLVLLSTSAVYMVEGDHLMLNRAANQRTVEQGMQLALGSERWAARVLQRDLGEAETDHLGEAWNTLGVPVAVDDAVLRTSVLDMQGRFNLNNLNRRDEVWYPAFVRLLRLLELDEGIAEAVVDWIDEDTSRTHSSGAEDLEYQLYEPPYRAANRPMVDPGEMLLVQGVTEEMLAKLAPFVMVTPDGRQTRINVNTSPPLLFRVLSEQVTAADSESLTNARGETGFESLEAFLQRAELAGEANMTAEPMISLASDYFMVNSQVEIENMALAIDSVIRRNPSRASVEIIARYRGSL